MPNSPKASLAPLTKTGRFHYAIQEQHRKHGPVVRVSPNELSFATVESWKAIYGHRVAGAPPVIKSEFYEIYGAGFKSLRIGSERDPHKHGQMRKMLSAAFSTKMLLDQEDIITKTVDAFIHGLGEDGFKLEGLNMTKWFEMIAFDSLGEMAFGESFHSVRAGKFSIDGDFQNSALAGRWLDEIAGGETTATFLAAATDYLLRNSVCLLKLQAEIKNIFSSFEEINATAARQLPCFQAVNNEGLRVYAPGSQGFPRLSPGMKVGDIYVPAGAEVFTHEWTLTHSEQYFSDPKSFKPERWLDADYTDV
ncbi:BCL4p [Colletotrichum salicis]|uniref:BCL4p n=1 Tax=Colletotrichum salicis TaxID=1209931 RepID=A0A135U0K1_9PEZI|nr:BCL4p [Colletotrichum salicis]